MNQGQNEYDKRADCENQIGEVRREGLSAIPMAKYIPFNVNLLLIFARHRMNGKSIGIANIRFKIVIAEKPR